MRREHLAHLLRAASRVVDRRDLLVVGSQSVLGTWDEAALPEAAILSLEADLAVFDDPDGELADRISGAIGELSSFDQSFGYHADGVGLETAILPAGWQERLMSSTLRTRSPVAVCVWSRTTASSRSWSRGDPRIVRSPRP